MIYYVENILEEDNIELKHLIVEPDSIRRDVTGNVSNISQDGLVWSLVPELLNKNLKNYGFANRFFETKSGDIYGSCGSGSMWSETIYKLEGDSCRAVYNSPNSRIYRDNYSINHIEPDSLLGFKIPAVIPYGFWDSLSRKYPTFPMNIIEENPGTNELLVYASRGIFASDTSFRKWRKVSDYSEAQPDSTKFKYYTDKGISKNYRFSAGNYVALKPYDSLFIRTKDTVFYYGPSEQEKAVFFRKLICYN